MRSLFFALIVVMLVGENSCSHHTKNERKVNFDNTILITEKKIIGLTAPGSVFRVPEFMKVYENPGLYHKDAIKYLSRPDRTIDQKKIAIYSQQNGDVSEYLDFVRQSLKLFEANIISEYLFSETLSNPADKNFMISKNYGDKEVRELISGLMQHEKISPELKFRLDSILSGSVWQHIKDVNGIGD
jgi:hypothetical protein